MKKGLLLLTAWWLTGAGVGVAQELPAPIPQADPFILTLPQEVPPHGGPIIGPLPALVDQPAHREYTSGLKSKHCAGPRFWITNDYLLWWVKPGPQPLPLVTTGPTAPVDFSTPGNTVLYGPATFNYGLFSGYRLTLGGWLDADQRFRVQGRALLLDQTTTTGFSIGNVPSPTLFAVPFFDLATGTESSFLTNSAIRTGSVAVNSSNRLWGAEANGLYKV